MRKFLIILSVCLSIIIASSAMAAGFAKVGTFGFTWEGIFTGSRVAALGGSDLTDDGPSTFLFNPAPLSRGNFAEVGYEHADYFFDLYLKNYAGTAEWNSVRLSLAVQDINNEDVIIRTAYNPEGSGKIDLRDRMMVIGASYDIGRGLMDHPSFQWSVGGAWREYSSNYFESIRFSSTMDVGTTVGWKKDYQGGWAGVTGVMAWQNILAASYTFDEGLNDREYSLPKSWRGGVTLETGLDWSGHEGNLVKLLAAYSNCKYSNWYRNAESNHKGLEAVFLDTLAVRWGYSTRVTGNIDSWGIGLMLDGRLLGPFTIQADVGEMGYDTVLSQDPENIWGLRIGYNF